MSNEKKKSLPTWLWVVIIFFGVSILGKACGNTPSQYTPSTTSDTSSESNTPSTVPPNYKDYTWDDWNKEKNKDAVAEDILRRAQKYK